MELTVVLPCRNGARTIGRQLEALSRQRWDQPWELVISDNGSTDGTREVVERFSDRLPGLRIVDSSDLAGLPHARNAGVAAARGRTIAFCDDDDEVAEGWVAAMGDALRKHDLVAGVLEHDRLNELWAVAVRGRPQTDALPTWGWVTSLPFAFGCSIGITRALHDAVGGFDEDLVPSGEDMDYCWRLQATGARFHLAKDAVTHYRVRHDLRDIYRQARSYGRGDVLVYKKHRELGIPRTAHPVRTGIRHWLALAGLFARGTTRARRAVAVWHLGLRVGMLQWSVRERVLLL